MQIYLFLRLLPWAAPDMVGLFSEGDKSEAYEIFQKALRVKRIRHYSLLSPDQTEHLFMSLEKYCADISYFRVQYGLSFQLVKRFSETNNQFLYAQNIRPNSYQVAHALAKNRMEIGLDDLRYGRSSADDNFQLERFSEIATKEQIR